MNKVQLIGGRWLAGQGADMQSVNPADGDVLWQGQCASSDQVDRAVEKARRAFYDWSDRSLDDRLEQVRRFGKTLAARKDELIDIIAQETGKPRWDCAGELAAMIGKVEISVRAYHDRTGYHEGEVGGVKTVLQHRPHGVLAVFGPYNFPGHLPNGHIIPALIAGNTVVFKPSELTPWTAQKTLEIWQESGLPEGVINLLQGEVETGKALAGHGGIDGLLFTGSVRTGQILHNGMAGDTAKILALELGGNNPLLVMPGADRKAVVFHTIQSAYLSSGQRCTCARRLLLPEGGEGDAVLASLAAAVDGITVGAWNDEPQPFMGPVISEAAADGLVSAFQNLQQMGAKVIRPLEKRQVGTGFITPGLLDVQTIAGQLPDEEYFGPLLQVMRYRDFDHGLELANRTRYGLSAALLGGEQSDFDKFTRRIRAGVVNWNRATNGASSAAPFGGVGLSGNHRPSAYYAADYCAWPMAAMALNTLSVPDQISPGLSL